MRLMQAKPASVSNVIGVVAHPTKKLNSMRGGDTFIESMFTMPRLDDFVPESHPFRPIYQKFNRAYLTMSTLFARMYAHACAPLDKFVCRRRDKRDKIEDCYQATKKQHPKRTDFEAQNKAKKSKPIKRESLVFLPMVQQPVKD